MSTVSFGKGGESIASSYLQSRGFRVVGKNIRTVAGEADLVAMLSNTLVVIEVKRRSDTENPEEAVNPRKVARLARIAEILAGRYGAEEFRIDVIAVTGNRISGHLQNIEIA